MGNKTSVEGAMSAAMPDLSMCLNDQNEASKLELQCNKYMSKRLRKLFLTCDICFTHFDMTEHAPKSLHCQHTYCLACLKQIQENASSYNSIHCPKCRTEFVWDGDLQNIPNDHKLVKLFDFLSANAKGNVNVCVTHGLQPLKFYCVSCDVPVCKECTSTLHDQTVGHDVNHIREIMQSKKSLAYRILEEAKVIINKLDKRCSNLLMATGNMNAMKEISELEIDEVFETLRLDLETRKAQLKETLHQKSIDKKAWINNRKKQLKNIQDVYKSQVTELATSMEVQDYARICSLLKSVESLHEPVKMMADYNDEDVEPAMAFNIPTNFNLTSEVRKLGVVQDRVFSEEESEHIQIERSKIEIAEAKCLKSAILRQEQDDELKHSKNTS